MICDDDFYAGKCPARKEDGQCVSKYHCSHKVEPPKPPTNADRIRSMTDEELAELFEEICYDSMAHRAKYWLHWLQRPAEEDDHD